MSNSIKSGLAAALIGTAMIAPVQASKQEPLRQSDFGPAKSGTGYIATYDAKPQIEAYATLVHRLYSTSHQSAQTMERAITRFLDTPSESTLAAARFAWINAPMRYLQAAESSYKALLPSTASLKETGKLAGVKVIVPTPEQ